MFRYFFFVVVAFPVEKVYILPVYFFVVIFLFYFIFLREERQCTFVNVCSTSVCRHSTIKEVDSPH